MNNAMGTCASGGGGSIDLMDSYGEYLQRHPKYLP